MRMIRPVSYEEAAALLPDFMRPGLKTNLADFTALKRDELRILERENGLFLLRRRESWWLLNFLMTGGPVPALPGRVVTELVSGPRESEAALTGLFEEAGFRTVLTRVRLTRPPSAPPADAPAPPVSPAGPEELEEVMALLRACFEPLTGCLPGREALMEDLTGGRVLAVREAEGIAGLLRYSAAGRRAEIRQLAVRRERRCRGLAGALTASFLARNAAARCAVWTGSDNGAALAVYRKKGFIEDGYRSSVMMKG